MAHGQSPSLYTARRQGASITGRDHGFSFYSLARSLPIPSQTHTPRGFAACPISCFPNHSQPVRLAASPLAAFLGGKRSCKFQDRHRTNKQTNRQTKSRSYVNIIDEQFIISSKPCSIILANYRKYYPLDYLFK